MERSRVVSLAGTIVGKIWMPCAECTLEVELTERDFRYSDNSRPTIRDFALRATNDGNFQSAALTADSVFIFERIRQTARTTTISRRVVPVTAFKSIQDCVDARESWELRTDEDEE